MTARWNTRRSRPFWPPREWKEHVEEDHLDDVIDEPHAEESAQLDEEIGEAPDEPVLPVAQTAEDDTPMEEGMDTPVSPSVEDGGSPDDAHAQPAPDPEAIVSTENLAAAVPGEIVDEAGQIRDELTERPSDTQEEAPEQEQAPSSEAEGPRGNALRRGTGGA